MMGLFVLAAFWVSETFEEPTSLPVCVSERRSFFGLEILGI
jgi:hypothetical protein